jgi:AAA15 family ATPase/GTPase
MHPRSQPSAKTLHSSEAIELLNVIDGLRSLGIDDEIPLPQIVVVGQESSGKSSVLEAISGVAFLRTTDFARDFR